MGEGFHQRICWPLFLQKRLAMVVQLVLASTVRGVVAGLEEEEELE